jgi:hypothetical protein
MGLEVEGGEYISNFCLRIGNMEELVKIFIDYKNTFDSMRREEIWL